MYIDSSTVRGSNGKIYQRVLLRESFREEGKVKKRTIANLSGRSEEEIEAIKFGLQNQHQLQEIQRLLQQGQSADDVLQSKLERFAQGPSVGAIFTLATIAQELGITDALGDDRHGKLALWQIIARALDQGSRLSAVRLARDLGACAVLDLPEFNEDHLYANLAWLEQNQARIEDALFQRRTAQKGGHSLYLYDVTSTYLEGERNAFAAFGYNRDKKRGKKQIVVGLLCDEAGVPLSIEAFSGNTGDTSTVASQVSKLKERFHSDAITLVGDRGMIRGPQIELLQEEGFHYISAINKPQIESMLRDGTIQLELFENTLGEIILETQADEAQGKNLANDPSAPVFYERYVFRRNPQRQAEIMASRMSKKASVEALVENRNCYLEEHPRAKAETAVNLITKRIEKLRLSLWLGVKSEGRKVFLEVDEEVLKEASKLDGCYVLKTDLRPEQADKTQIHSRYKDLSQVEQAFRRSKTVELEMRPVYVRTKSSTRGHLLVVMLAYQVMMELGQRWALLDMTVEEGLKRLTTYCAIEVDGKVPLLPQPRQDVQGLLDTARITLPDGLIQTLSKVSTKTSLQNSRKTRRK